MWIVAHRGRRWNSSERFFNDAALCEVQGVWRGAQRLILIEHVE